MTTDNMATLPTLNAGQSQDILTTTTENYFSDSQITGEHQYEAHDVTEEAATNGVTFSGTQSKGVKASGDGKNLVYTAGTFDVQTVSLGEMKWNEGRTATAGYNFANLKTVDAANLAFAFATPETLTPGDAAVLLAANDTLADFAAQEKNASYTYAPVAGVTLDGTITGRVAKSGNSITYTATANRADKLTFGDVAWKDEGALLTRPANLTFDGADVDTTNIRFTKF